MTNPIAAQARQAVDEQNGDGDIILDPYAEGRPHQSAFDPHLHAGTGPHPVFASAEKLMPADPAQRLAKAQNAFIKAQTKYIHDKNLDALVAAQVEYIRALSIFVGSKKLGSLATAQEEYIMVLQEEVERLDAAAIHEAGPEDNQSGN